MTVLFSQTMIATTNVVPRTREFGFLHQDGERDTFVTVAMLEKAGFEPALSQGDNVVADVLVLADGKHRVKSIHAVNGKTATGKVYRPQPTERRVVVDTKKEDGFVQLVIVKVTSLIADIEFFEVRARSSSGEILGTYRYLKQARDYAGIVYNPPKVVGGKTNVPGRGPAKGKTGEQGGGKKGRKKSA